MICARHFQSMYQVRIRGWGEVFGPPENHK